MASTLMIAESLLVINSQKESFKAPGLSEGRRRRGGWKQGKEGSKVSCEGLMDTSAFISLFLNERESKPVKRHTRESQNCRAMEVFRLGKISKIFESNC